MRLQAVKWGRSDQCERGAHLHVKRAVCGVRPLRARDERHPGVPEFFEGEGLAGVLGVSHLSGRVGGAG
jgi:hypothetical protein